VISHGKSSKELLKSILNKISGPIFREGGLLNSTPEERQKELAEIERLERELRDAIEKQGQENIKSNGHK
jgi:hypothetical protein